MLQSYSSGVWVCQRRVRTRFQAEAEEEEGGCRDNDGQTSDNGEGSINGTRGTFSNVKNEADIRESFASHRARRSESRFVSQLIYSRTRKCAWYNAGLGHNCSGNHFEDLFL
jgi:hypothetical protein